MATTKKTQSTTSTAPATKNNRKETTMTNDKRALTATTIIGILEASEEKPQNYYKISKDNLIKDKNYFNGELLVTTKNQILLEDADHNYYIVRAQNDHTITKTINFGNFTKTQTETINDTQNKVINRLNYQNNTSFKKLTDFVGQPATITHLLTDEGYTYYEITNFRNLDRTANLLPEQH